MDISKKETGDLLKTWIWMIVLLVTCVGVVMAANYFRQQGDDRAIAVNDQIKRPQDKPAPKPVESRSLAESLGLEEEDMVEVGGVTRPKRDVARPKEFDADAIRAKYLASLPKVGTAPSVDKNASPAAAKLLEEAAEEDGEHRYRSTSSKTDPFDKAVYLAAPQEYLVKTRPGRIRQTATPGPGVKPLRSQGAQFFEVLQGESVFLTAMAEPGMPVTFHTQQLGQFGNRLKTISVAADKKGVARVKYLATTGVVGSVFVMAASPVHSGRLDYLVEVSVGSDR